MVCICQGLHGNGILLLFIGIISVPASVLWWDMWGCSSHRKKWAVWLCGNSCEWWQCGSLFQAGGAGEEVGRGRRLLIQTFPLPLWVPQFLAVPTNPRRPEERNWLQLPAVNTLDSDGCKYPTIYVCKISLNYQCDTCFFVLLCLQSFIDFIPIFSKDNSGLLWLRFYFQSFDHQ